MSELRIVGGGCAICPAVVEEEVELRADCIDGSVTTPPDVEDSCIDAWREPGPRLAEAEEVEEDNDADEDEGMRGEVRVEFDWADGDESAEKLEPLLPCEVEPREEEVDDKLLLLEGR